MFLFFFFSSSRSRCYLLLFCSFAKCWDSVPVSMILCFTVKADERTFMSTFQASARVLIKGKLHPEPRVHLIIPLDEIFRNVILRVHPPVSFLSFLHYPQCCAESAAGRFHPRFISIQERERAMQQRFSLKRNLWFS